MKKVIHRDFYYQIPEKSGFTLIETQGLHRYIFVDEIEFTQPDLHSFLLKILTALKLEVGNNLEIISCQQNRFYPIHPIISQQNIDLVCFGVRPSQLQLQGFEAVHHVYHFLESTFLFANSLKSYSNEASKKILWTNLKIMFNIQAIV